MQNLIARYLENFDEVNELSVDTKESIPKSIWIEFIKIQLPGSPLSDSGNFYW